jgi:hypothetical protein
MKYLVQVRFNGADAVIHRLPTEEQDNITSEFQAVRKLSGVLDGNQLEPAGTAKTVRVSDGQTLISDGPGADEAAAINGYYIRRTSMRRSRSRLGSPSPAWAAPSRCAR